MSTQTIQQAREAGYEGAQRAATRAGEGWQETAYAAFVTFVNRLGYSPFTIEDARVGCCDVPPPPDGRARGHIATRARRAGVIVACGYAPTRSSNGSPKVLWRKAGKPTPRVETQQEMKL